MWRILIMVMLAALAGCSTQQGTVRLHCERHLVPINGPAPTNHHSDSPSSSPPSGGERR